MQLWYNKIMSNDKAIQTPKYASADAFSKAAKALKQETFEVDVPELGQVWLFSKNISAESFYLISDEMTARAEALKQIQKKQAHLQAQEDRKAKREKRQPVQIEMDNQEVLKMMGDNPAPLFAKAIIAAAIEPALDFETHYQDVLSLPFDLVFRVGGEVLEHIGDASEEDFAKRQARFREEPAGS